MSQTNTTPLLVALGERLRELREVQQKRQGDMAAAARKCGLRWTQATVAAVETGRRRLSIEELLLLPFILFEAKIHKPKNQERPLLELADIFPKEGMVPLTTKTRVHAEALQEILQGKFGEGWLGHYDTPHLRQIRAKISITPEKIRRLRDELEKIFQILPEANRNHRLLEEIEKEVEGEAEQKVARKFKVPPLAVGLAARKVWGHSLTVERDRRIAKQGTNETSLRSLQATRGHVTRALLTKIRPLIAGLSKSQSSTG